MRTVRGALLLVALAAVVAPFALGARERAELRFRPFASGFDQPVYVAATPSQPRALYVVEKTGRIKVLENGQRRVFLDIHDLVSTGSEQGLLSMAFHPSYATNRLFYVDYTDTNGDTRVVEYRVVGGTPRRTRQVLFVHQPYANHNGGQLEFGPDGRLYVGMGDGGSEGDPQNRGQNLGTFLAKLLRANVNASRPQWQIVSYGLRNPWRFSFDRSTGDLWIADVGQNRYEEIDFRRRALIGRIANYGWSRYEGFSLYKRTPLNRRGQLVWPVTVYTHGGGNCSVTGGYVYRGSAVPAARGRYFYGDWCTGRIWSLTRSGGRTHVRLEPSRVPRLTSFGEDASGELYAASQGGSIYKLTG